ncbi:MAG TPA: hypothetical protein VI279_15485 [Rhodocyclaceae bacterium]
MDPRDLPASAPSLQAVLASLLWALSSPPQSGRCPRQQAITVHQLRFVLRHCDTEPLLRDVAAQVLSQLEDELSACLQAPAGAGRLTALAH